MKAAAGRERGASVSSESSVLIRPTFDALVLVLVLPLFLLIVVLVPWGVVHLSSPHLQLLGIALTFASVLLCLKMACSACPRDSSGLDGDTFSRRNPQQGLLSSIEDGPPNYESIMAANPQESTRWVVTIEPHQPNVSQPQSDPPPYHAVVIEGLPDQKNIKGPD